MIFWVFGDNLEYFSSTNSLFLTFGVLEIFVDKHCFTLKMGKSQVWVDNRPKFWVGMDRLSLVKGVNVGPI